MIGYLHLLYALFITRGCCFRALCLLVCFVCGSFGGLLLCCECLFVVDYLFALMVLVVMIYVCDFARLLVYLLLLIVCF